VACDFDLVADDEAGGGDLAPGDDNGATSHLCDGRSPWGPRGRRHIDLHIIRGRAYAACIPRLDAEEVARTVGERRGHGVVLMPEAVIM